MSRNKIFLGGLRFTEDIGLMIGSQKVFFVFNWSCSKIWWLGLWGFISPVITLFVFIFEAIKVFNLNLTFFLLFDKCFFYILLVRKTCLEEISVSKMGGGTRLVVSLFRRHHHDRLLDIEIIEKSFKKRKL